MKIFLDVGAHVGQTLIAAKGWDFDRIVCFEPAIQHLPALQALADERTIIEPFGLWNKDAEKPLYNIGTQGASFWKRPQRPTNSGVCKFVQASKWLASNTTLSDTVWMKLNVEGAELDVITDLLDTGAMELIDYLEIMWDAKKIPEIADKVDAVRSRIESLYAPPRVVSTDRLPKAEKGSTCTERVDAWISMTSARRK